MEQLSFDFVVVGGGMSGLCAAIAAARHGARTALVHARPMPGGNASSEIRMHICGADDHMRRPNARETGIIEEILLEHKRRNPANSYAVFDSILWEKAAFCENLTLLLNTCVDGVTMRKGRIESVTAYQQTTEKRMTLCAPLFADATGDGSLGAWAGADFVVGREARSAYDEPHAPEKADHCTMGNSLMFKARDAGHPVPFIKPDWANTYTEHDLRRRIHEDVTSGYWWIELGGEQDTIADTQTLNMELLKIAFGVWDHIKNRGDHGADNWELEWVGFLPGKRESRRYEGDYMLTQQDLSTGRPFPDVVAYGGWTMDNHLPAGFYAPGYSSHHLPVNAPYPIPYRCLYSRNIDNLMFAGRNISASHLAMSSTRVMATCSLMGQAAGAAAALAVEKTCDPRGIYQDHMAELQRRLMDDGCYLPGLTRKPAPTQIDLPSEQLALLQNDWERPHAGVENRILLPAGTRLTITLPAPARRQALRLALDPDFSRESISPRKKYQDFAMRAHVFADDPPLQMPAPLLREATLICETPDGPTALKLLSHQALLRIPLPDGASRLTLCLESSWGGGDIGLYGCEIMDV